MNNISEDLVNWETMNRLAENGEVAEFFRQYAKYLEKSNIISHGRSSLHKMALAAANLIEQKGKDA